MTKRSPPNRNDELVGKDGRASLRFAQVLEDLVEDVNDLGAKPVRNITENTTLIITDVIVRNTGGNVVVTIPASTAVEFDIGTGIEFQNDGSGTMKIAIDTDTLTDSSGLGTGTRTIATNGEGRALLVADTQWKFSGEQIT